MKHNRAGYYIKEGINSIFNHGFMSFASICIIVACLLIMGSFTLLALNVQQMIKNMESENQILAYVDDSYTDEEAMALEAAIEAVPNVIKAEFIHRDEAMESFMASYDNPSLFEGLDSSVLRHSFIIHLEDISLMEETRDDLGNVPGIARVNIQLEIAEGFVKVRNIVSAVSMVLVAILFVVSLFIMSNTVKLTTFERRDEIAIMRMVGATPTFIRWPFVVEGLILGTFGSLTAYILQWAVYQLVTEKIISSAGFLFMSTLSFSAIAVPLLIAFLIVGFGVGVIGSLIAIKNYLKV